MATTAFDLAQRFVGIMEVPGAPANPQVLAFLQLEQPGAASDEIAWCSAFVNYPFWLLRLPRSKSLAARSWLAVGVAVQLYDATPGFDVVVLRRGAGAQPGPEVLNAPGHVGFFAGLDRDRVLVLGGNQGNRVCVESFPAADVLGVRRMAPAA